MLDLILPIECGGCGAPSTRWCAACADELAIGLDAPRVVTPRVDPGVPVFALGRYAGARRRAIVAMKDRGRSDLSEPLAHALGKGVHRLLTWGLLDVPLTIVPAPTRGWSASDQRLSVQQLPIHPLNTLHQTIIPAQTMFPERRADYSAPS